MIKSQQRFGLNSSTSCPGSQKSVSYLSFFPLHCDVPATPRQENLFIACSRRGSRIFSGVRVMEKSVTSGSSPGKGYLNFCHGEVMAYGLRLVLVTHAARQRADGSELSSAMDCHFSIMKATQPCLPSWQWPRRVEESELMQPWPRA